MSFVVFLLTTKNTKTLKRKCKKTKKVSERVFTRRRGGAEKTYFLITKHTKILKDKFKKTKNHLFPKK